MSSGLQIVAHENPLRYLFVDMNSYFASVEQQEHPRLRNRPVAVVPMLTDSTSCIAASYEAKKFGVKTGTNVGLAKQLCPGIQLIEAKHEIYIQYHHRFIAAIESCLHVDKVVSIDEVSCGLIGTHRTENVAIDLARQIKAALKSQVGECIRASIGIGPNQLLAKMASDMQKPDGLIVIRAKDLPTRLYELKLTDFPGVGRNMLARLHRYGITTVEQFCQLNVDQLARIWGSKLLGRIWWHRLRGDELPDVPTKRRSVSHSHVLPPDMRTDDGARSVLICMTHKAAARLRRMNCWAQSISISVSFKSESYDQPGGSWHQGRRILSISDTHSIVQHVAEMWTEKPDGKPLKVGVALGDMIPTTSATRLLFDENIQMTDVSKAMDQINSKLGDHAVYLGSMFGAQKHDPLRIAFTQIPEVRKMHEAKSPLQAKWAR